MPALKVYRVCICRGEYYFAKIRVIGNKGGEVKNGENGQIFSVLLWNKKIVLDKRVWGKSIHSLDNIYPCVFVYLFSKYIFRELGKYMRHDNCFKYRVTSYIWPCVSGT